MNYKRLNEIDKTIDDINSFLEFLKYKGLLKIEFGRWSGLGDIDFTVCVKNRLLAPKTFFRRTNIARNVLVKVITDHLLLELNKLKTEKRAILNKKRFQFRL